MGLPTRMSDRAAIDASVAFLAANGNPALVVTDHPEVTRRRAAGSKFVKGCCDSAAARAAVVAGIFVGGELVAVGAGTGENGAVQARRAERRGVDRRAGEVSAAQVRAVKGAGLHVGAE